MTQFRAPDVTFADIDPLTKGIQGWCYTSEDQTPVYNWRMMFLPWIPGSGQTLSWVVRSNPYHEVDDHFLVSELLAAFRNHDAGTTAPTALPETNMSTTAAFSDAATSDAPVSTTAPTAAPSAPSVIGTDNYILNSKTLIGEVFAAFGNNVPIPPYDQLTGVEHTAANNVEFQTEYRTTSFSPCPKEGINDFFCDPIYRFVETAVHNGTDPLSQHVDLFSPYSYLWMNISATPVAFKWSGGNGKGVRLLSMPFNLSMFHDAYADQQFERRCLANRPLDLQPFHNGSDRVGCYNPCISFANSNVVRELSYILDRDPALTREFPFLARLFNITDNKTSFLLEEDRCETIALQLAMKFAVGHMLDNPYARTPVTTFNVTSDEDCAEQIGWVYAFTQNSVITAKAGGGGISWHADAIPSFAIFHSSLSMMNQYYNIEVLPSACPWFIREYHNPISYPITIFVSIRHVLFSLLCGVIFLQFPNVFKNFNAFRASLLTTLGRPPVEEDRIRDLDLLKEEYNRTIMTRKAVAQRYTTVLAKASPTGSLDHPIDPDSKFIEHAMAHVTVGKHYIVEEHVNNAIVTKHLRSIYQLLREDTIAERKDQLRQRHLMEDDPISGSTFHGGPTSEMLDSPRHSEVSVYSRSTQQTTRKSARATYGPRQRPMMRSRAASAITNDPASKASLRNPSMPPAKTSPTSVAPKTSMPSVNGTTPSIPVKEGEATATENGNGASAQHRTEAPSEPSSIIMTRNTSTMEAMASTAAILQSKDLTLLSQEEEDDLYDEEIDAEAKADAHGNELEYHTLALQKYFEEDHTAPLEPVVYCDNLFEFALSPPKWILNLKLLYVVVLVGYLLSDSIRRSQDRGENGKDIFFIYFFLVCNCPSTSAVIVGAITRARMLGYKWWTCGFVQLSIFFTFIPCAIAAYGILRSILIAFVPILVGFILEAVSERLFRWWSRSHGRSSKKAQLIVGYAMFGLFRTISRIILYIGANLSLSMGYNMVVLVHAEQFAGFTQAERLQYEFDSRSSYCLLEAMWGNGQASIVLQLIPGLPYVLF